MMNSFQWWADLPENIFYVPWEHIPRALATLQNPGGNEFELSRVIAEDGIKKLLRSWITEDRVTIRNPGEGYSPVQGNLAMIGGVVDRVDLERFSNGLGVGLRISPPAVDAPASIPEATAKVVAHWNARAAAVDEIARLAQLPPPSTRDEAQRAHAEETAAADVLHRLDYPLAEEYSLEEVIEFVHVDQGQDTEAKQAATTVTMQTAPTVGAPVPVESKPEQTSPRFAMKKAALIVQYAHQWPTIERDLKDASQNGLSIAKAGLRDWHEEMVLEWGRCNGKLTQSSPATPASTMPTLVSLPSVRHRMDG